MNRKTILIIRLFVLVIALFVVIGIAVSFFFRFDMRFIFGGDKTMQESKSFTDVQNININTISYKVEILEHDKEYVQITEELFGFHTSNNELYQEGDTVYYKQKREFFPFSISGGTIIVRVPKDSAYNFDLDGVSGSVAFHAMSNRVDIDIVSGSITIEGGGSELAAKSVSGSIRVYEGYESVQAETTSGSVRVAASQDTYYLKAETTSGSVKIKLPEDKGYRFRYSVTSGSVKDYYNGNGIKDSKKGEIVQGDGEIDIQAATTSGSIKLMNWE